jgi:hypothetical protein
MKALLGLAAGLLLGLSSTALASHQDEHMLYNGIFCNGHGNAVSCVRMDKHGYMTVISKKDVIVGTFKSNHVVFYRSNSGYTP